MHSGPRLPSGGGRRAVFAGRSLVKDNLTGAGFVLVESEFVGLMSTYCCSRELREESASEPGNC